MSSKDLKQNALLSYIDQSELPQGLSHNEYIKDKST
jgi:hypothetical protein